MHQQGETTGRPNLLVIHTVQTKLEQLFLQQSTPHLFKLYARGKLAIDSELACIDNIARACRNLQFMLCNSLGRLRLFIV
jgi:hypothetical protein